MAAFNGTRTCNPTTITMKKRIVNWINSILGTTKKIDQLELQIISYRNEVANLHQQVNLFSKIINVGINVHHRHGRSWAVVCIQGKADYVNFVDLDPNEIRTIQMFLRNFERPNVTINGPKFPKDIFFKL